MTGWLVVALVIAVTVVLLAAGAFVPVWRRYRGTRLITCPENLRTAAVKVAAVDAATWFTLSGETPLHLATCSRWPEMAGCGQECLSQVETSPEACRVRTIVTNWYEGKHCHFCAGTIENIVWHERPPALRRQNGATVEWKDLRPEDLPDAFANCDAVCFNCHIRETFRRDHEELVVDRARPLEIVHALPPSLAVY